jgi:hypothetical protein
VCRQKGLHLPDFRQHKRRRLSTGRERASLSTSVRMEAEVIEQTAALIA